MNKEVEYWKWKNTIIDFDNISDEKDEYGSYATKKDIVFHYLGTPDNDIHEWYNGGFSSEYNTALRYAKQLGLVEDYIDYEEELYTLKQQNNQLKEQLKLNDCKTIYNQFVNYKNWYFDYVDKYEKAKQENQQLHNKIDKAIELNREIDKSLRMKNTSAYIELEDIIFEQWKMLKKDSDVNE